MEVVHKQTGEERNVIGPKRRIDRHIENQDLLVTDDLTKIEGALPLGQDIASQEVHHERFEFCRGRGGELLLLSMPLS